MIKILGSLACAAMALLWAVPVAAAPCDSNFWQPTFVHDLDNEDGPYFVTGGGFLPLRWVANGGYVPHACELIGDGRNLRDRRGFTSCYEYTRIQCGCSRAIPGNDTCAAFLAWHTAVAPGGSGTPGGAQPGAAATVPLTPASWQQANQYSGGLVAVNAGLLLQGGAWTNGRLENGVYDGNRIRSLQAFDFSGGGDAYLRFGAHGAGQYMGIWPRVLEGVGVKYVTTHHSWDGSVVVPDDTWIFAHVRVEPDLGYRVTVALGSYDDAGGQVIYQNTGRLASPSAHFEMQFGDNYGGTEASVLIGEARVVTGARTAAPFTPQAGGLTSGSQCSVDTDCADSICLLGICAAQ